MTWANERPLDHNQIDGEDPETRGQFGKVDTGEEREDISERMRYKK
jgi:hypothetical protein